MHTVMITVFPPELGRKEPFTVRRMIQSEQSYSGELAVYDIETLETVLRKIETDPKILDTWKLYIEKDQPFTIPSTDQKWNEIADWLSSNQRSHYW